MNQNLTIMIPMNEQPTLPSTCSSFSYTQDIDVRSVWQEYVSQRRRSMRQSLLDSTVDSAILEHMTIVIDSDKCHSYRNAQTDSIVSTNNGRMNPVQHSPVAAKRSIQSIHKSNPKTSNGRQRKHLEHSPAGIRDCCQIIEEFGSNMALFDFSLQY
jgi:hypothetical protein